MRQSKHEPTLADRLEAQAAARRAMLERLKPKPHVPAAEVVPWAQREAERLRQLRARPKPVRQLEVSAVVVAFAASIPAPKSYEAPRPPAPEPIRYSVGVDGVHQQLRRDRQRRARRREQMAEWKTQQWKAGNRSCTYCTGSMVLRQGFPNSATVDHVDPLAEDGSNDVPENYAMACYYCNHRKGRMSVEAFRALLASERVAVAAE